MKEKLICMIAMLLSMCCFPTSVNDASEKIYVEVIKNNALIRAFR